MVDFDQGGSAHLARETLTLTAPRLSATRRVSPELLAADDALIDEAVALADPLALRGLLYQLTGDEELPAMEVKTVFLAFGEGRAMADEADVRSIRDKATALLKTLRGGAVDEVPLGPSERLLSSLCLAAGDEVPEEDLELWLEETGIDPWARGLEWREPPSPDRLEAFRVVVVGAGMAGLNAAVLLRQAGIRFTVVEKNSGVGGTWFENRYPGARVDTPSRSYMHIFGADFPYSSPFCQWHENVEYFNWAADEFDVRRDIVFDTEVTSCTWDDETSTWLVHAVGPSGEQELRADAVISAVGFLSRPSVPSIEGSEGFRGPAFHTARWPGDLDLAGKRVAVIGTGCSGYQTFPEIARRAGHAFLFQRTPQWVLPTKGYLQPFPDPVTWLNRNMPFYANFMRFRSQWVSGPKSAALQKTIDPSWADPHSRNAANARMRENCVEFIRTKLASRPELVDRMIPPHPVWGARPVLADADDCILDALLRDNVDLVSDGIARITSTGIETVDGQSYDVDVIVYATGFKANDFLWPMEVRGRDGVDVEELWSKDGPRAYLGTMLPGFPNMFLLYGPNTNPMGGLGVSQHEEMMTRYALEVIQMLIVDGYEAIEPKADAYWRYNDALDRRERTLIYGEPTVRNYYRCEHDRSAANCPFPGNWMWGWLRKPDVDDLVIR
jgi:4-hydroxyacetophenone monooxygenase